MSAPHFDAAAFDRRYAFLDDCPEPFIAALVTLPVGTLAERVQGLLAWRAALLAGRLPPASAWPPAEVAAPARQALEALQVARFCEGQPELVDALLRDVLASFAGQHAALQAEIAAQLRILEQLERERRAAEGEAKARAARLDRSPQPAELDPKTLDRLRARAQREAAAAARPEDARLRAAWEERARAWAEIAEVFGDLGGLMGRGWDLCPAVIRQVGWSQLVQLRALVAKLPQLREIVRSLGRLHDSAAEETVADQIFVPVRRLEEERREVRTPEVPAETRGVERSGEIARMLPAEAVNLGHPKLRLLWHARRAERALLTYRVEGIELQRVWVEREHAEAREQRRPRPERGPIIAVLDTSGSMHGAPEAVAKALVLEALRTAHAEKRRCFAYMFSGPGDVVELELSLSKDGIGRLLSFLGHTFGGGTDVGVLARVAQRLKAGDWKKADVVFASDGEWAAGAALIRDLEQAKATGVRFHGVQIGQRGRTGLHSVCDPVHIFQDWAHAGGWSRPR